ncbi:MAG: MerR family transcriptional regulator [Crocinitomicaceae bacterium]
MIRYSIKDLENYTEIKAHTIRIWEQRYNLLAPKRTESNIRYYSHEDLKKILNINLLYLNGLKISKIAKLSESEITQTAKKLVLEKSVSGNKEVDTLLIAITSMDADEIRKLLSDYEDEFGLRSLYMEIIIPLLVKMGELWQTNSISIAHEHHFSNILRDFYILKINNLTPAKKNGKSVILFLPEHEDHELSLLYFQYLLKEAGFKCIYLGKNVPLKDLEASIKQVKPDILLTNLITRIKERDMKKFLKELVERSMDTEIRVAGSYTRDIQDVVPSEITIVSSEQELLSV